MIICVMSMSMVLTMMLCINPGLTEDEFLLRSHCAPGSTPPPPNRRGCSSVGRDISRFSCSSGKDMIHKLGDYILE